MNPIISYAIGNLQLISFYYESTLRIVEPHCYGLTLKGNQVLRAYQIDGQSTNGELGWKLFNLSKAENITLLESKFTQRGDYKKGDKGMYSIFHEL